MKVNFLPGEYWYGTCVKYGMAMPLHEKSEIELDFTRNWTPNQAMPLLLSTRGRSVWRDTGFAVTVRHGVMTVPDDAVLEAGFGNLKGAYLHAVEKYFPFCKEPPAEELFRRVIYNTWIELLFSQNQKDIMDYANKIVESGMPQGVLMIDDGWAESYGDWRFHSGKFPEAEKMLDELHRKGFQVMLWVCPFVSSDTEAYRDARDRNILIKTRDGETYITKWWNGYSAVLDLSNEDAAEWLELQLARLMKAGVDGFKFDGGDSICYTEDMVTIGNTSPDEQSRLWAEFGSRYSFNEYRATVKAGGMGLLQRLCDKEHSWGKEGAASLIPDMLLQGITGHPYGCPDMIGGGEYLNFKEASAGGLDEELFVRHCEIACLMPAIQFSAAPFRILNHENFEAVMESLRLRETFLPVIWEEVCRAAETGEPVIRYMVYEFPEEQAALVTDQFMLGSRFLIAPVYRKGQKGRKVYLPEGEWKLKERVLHGEKKQIWVESSYGQPLVFERLK